jgi:hypothetical protein
MLKTYVIGSDYQLYTNYKYDRVEQNDLWVSSTFEYLPPEVAFNECHSFFELSRDVFCLMISFNLDHTPGPGIRKNTSYSMGYIFNNSTLRTIGGYPFRFYSNFPPHSLKGKSPPDKVNSIIGTPLRYLEKEALINAIANVKGKTNVAKYIGDIISELNRGNNVIIKFRDAKYNYFILKLLYICSPIQNRLKYTYNTYVTNPSKIIRRPRIQFVHNDIFNNHQENISKFNETVIDIETPDTPVRDIEPYCSTIVNRLTDLIDTGGEHYETLISFVRNYETNNISQIGKNVIGDEWRK